MNNYPGNNTNSTTGDWLTGTIRRNPEGLLLLAAGCALLMRTAGSPLSKSFSGTPSHDGLHDHRHGGRLDPTSHSSLGEGISRAAEGVSDYASSVKDKVTETASSYASSVSDYADETRRNISDQSARLKRQAQSTLQSGMDRMLREQPLALAVLGVAAGAAVAAVFPTTEAESRALGGAREAITDAASKAGENLIGAAGAAGERLKSAAAERGLDPEGLKEMARDAADTFSTAMTGKPEDDHAGPVAKSSSPSMVPDNAEPAGGRGPEGLKSARNAADTFSTATTAGTNDDRSPGSIAKSGQIGGVSPKGFPSNGQPGGTRGPR